MLWICLDPLDDATHHRISKIERCLQPKALCATCLCPSFHATNLGEFNVTGCLSLGNITTCSMLGMLMVIMVIFVYHGYLWLSNLEDKFWLMSALVPDPPSPWKHPNTNMIK